MSETKGHSKNFERYLKGEMSSKEAHAFERASLDDHFTQEAIEGFEEQGVEHLADLKSLRGRFEEKKKGLTWWRYSAAAAILLLATYFIFLSLDRIDKKAPLASEDRLEEIAKTPKPDTIPSVEEPITKDKIEQDGLQKDEKLDESDGEREEFFIAEVQEDDVLLNEETEAVDAQTIALNDTEISSEETEVPQQFSVQSLESISSVEQVALEAEEVAADEIVLDEVLIEEESVAEALQGRAAGVQIEQAKAKKRATGAAARSAQAFSAVNQISGTVTDESGEALPGVPVLVKGTTLGTITDLDGNFQIDADSNETLIVSFIGFDTQEIALNGRDSITVALTPNVDALQEVVVTGYGASNKINEPSYTPATSVDGKKNYKLYLEENLIYPQSALDNEIGGIVVLQLTINPSGSIDKIDIKKSLGYGCDEEAIRLVREGPEWNAAERDGSNVEDEVRVRVKFKME